MMGAVEYGTARRIGFSATDPIFGKTGTCTDNRTPTHLGWFGSYNEVAGRKLAVVVLLTGGHSVSGPVASGVAGAVYKNLSDQNYFAQTVPRISPAALISTQPYYEPRALASVFRNTRAIPRTARRATTAPLRPVVLRVPAPRSGRAARKPR